MKRIRKPLFLIGFTFVSAAIIATGLFFAQASDKKKAVKPGKSQNLLGAPILVEDFSYADAALLTDNGWAAHSGGGTNPQTVTAPGLTYSGYAGSGVGNSVLMTTSGEDVNRSFAAPVTTGTLYASFLANVSASTATGDYFFHFHINASTFYGKVFIRKDAVNDNYSFGVSRNANAGTGAVFTPSTYTNGSTHLVVVKYTFVDGAANDTVSLFVDPTPGGAEPAATLTATDFGAADVASIPGVGIRQGTASSASTQRIDGIRVATTWADAVASGGPSPTPTPQKANVDMNGDGRTDFVITREIGSFLTNVERPQRRHAAKGDRMRARHAQMERKSADDAQAGSIPIEWWGANNGTSGGTNVVWGDSGFLDSAISADFDGDGSDDVAIWRPGPPDTAAFYSINSSDLTYRVQAFGQNGDDVSVVGDYDGDGKDDSASFRCPPAFGTPGQCYFFYRASSNNPTNGITYIPWGFGDSFDFFVYPGDFDGDGKHDFCLQAINPDSPEHGVFLLQNNDATYSQEYVHWGLANDFLAPGDYDGDGRSDFGVVRIEGDYRVFYILHRTGSMRAAQWGLADDDVVPGDYDGDGKQDIAIYRWFDPQPAFWILPSNGDPHSAFQYGITGDVPVASWYVH